MTTKRTLAIIAGIFGLAIAVVAVTFLTEPEAERTGAVRESAMLVQTTAAEMGTWQPRLRASGTVEPARDIMLRPRVSGSVQSVADAFTPGGRADEGEVLVRLDPADYENALAQRRSELQQARTNLELELGRQTVAREDLRLLSDSVRARNRSLVLREPQVNAARAQVASAEAAVDQARLALARTRVVAPFDAQILSRTANVGSQVGPGDGLARLVGVDRYWVVATVPQDRIPYLRFADDDPEQPSPAVIRNRTAWPASATREGTLRRLIGELEAPTRLARIVIEVDDPLAMDTATPNRPPLLLSSFVEVELLGRPVENAVRLTRDLVRNDDTVWVMEEGELQIRDVEIALRDAEYAYVTAGLADGDRIVTTDLATVVEGAPLRLASDGEGTS